MSLLEIITCLERFKYAITCLLAWLIEVYLFTYIDDPDVLWNCFCA